MSEPPIHKLPPELVCAIFVRLSFIQRLESSLVCSRWRAALLGNRLLWTDIYTREGPELRTFLARGRDEIKLHLWLTNQHPTVVRAALTKYRHAIDELHIHSAEEAAMSTTMQSLCMDWPMVKVLHLHRDVAVGVHNPSFVTLPHAIFGCDGVASGPATSAPNLRLLIIRGPILAPLMTLVQLASASSSNLRELVVLNQLQAVNHAFAFQMLAELPQLEVFVVGIDTSRRYAPIYADAAVGQGSNLRRLGVRFTHRLGDLEDALRPLHENAKNRVQLSTWQVGPSDPDVGVVGTTGYTHFSALERDYNHWDLILWAANSEIPAIRRHFAVSRIPTNALCTRLFRSASAATLVELTLDTDLLFNTQHDPIMERTPPLPAVESINIIISPGFPAFGHMNSLRMWMLFPLTVNRLPALRSVRLAISTTCRENGANLREETVTVPNFDAAIVSFFERQAKDGMRRLKWMEIAGITTRLTDAEVATFTDELRLRRGWVSAVLKLDMYDEWLVAG